jgi:hypothetical protein
MIIKELYRIREDGVKLYKTYSNGGYDLLQVETGIIYGEAIDVETSNYTYIEVEPEAVEATDEDYLKALEALGVN